MRREGHLYLTRLLSFWKQWCSWWSVTVQSDHREGAGATASSHRCGQEVKVHHHLRWIWSSWTLAICQQLWAKFPGSFDMVSAFVYHKDSWENIPNKTSCTCFYKMILCPSFLKAEIHLVPPFQSHYCCKFKMFTHKNKLHKIILQILLSGGNWFHLFSLVFLCVGIC